MSNERDDWKPETFQAWCLYHEEVFAFIRTVCSVIAAIAVMIILIKGL